MLYGTAQELISSQQSNPVVKNALVESFAFHLRNLIDFLYPKSPRPDDVIAQHFINDSVQTILGQISQNLEGRRNQANKQVAHLTEARKAGADPDKQWHIDQIIPEMTRLLKLFVENASPNRLHHNVKDFISTVISSSSMGATITSTSELPPIHKP